MRTHSSSRLLDSRIHSEEPQRSEKVLGYFLGPCLVYMVYSGIAGTYLTQFYTDVLGLAGGFLVAMPLLSKLLSSVVSLGIGRIIDRTRTAQGKARPWILRAGPLLTLCGILLYAVPAASYQVQIVWIVVSYSLFFSLAFSIYSLSHSLMVPLSTRNTKARDSLAMLTSMGTSMIPGMLSTILMPLLVRQIGVGEGAHSRWLAVMSVLSILAIPATLLEYYFTRERVTEMGSKTAAAVSGAGAGTGTDTDTDADSDAETAPKAAPDTGTASPKSQAETVSFARQVAACFRDRYWVMIVLFTLILHLCNGLTTSSMLYFCNWVLGNSVESGATRQILVNAIGQAPMGLGIAVLWPLVRKYGKRRVTLIGFTLASAGSLAVLLSGDHLVSVLVALFVKSIGSLPMYVMAALMAETLDHIEWSYAFRADGFSASVNSIIQVVALGLAQTILLAGISLLGYIAPASTAQQLVQPEAVRTFFRWCFAGLPMIGYAVCAFIMLFYGLERDMPAISADLAARRKG